MTFTLRSQFFFFFFFFCFFCFLSCAGWGGGEVGVGDCIACDALLAQRDVQVKV